MGDIYIPVIAANVKYNYNKHNSFSNYDKKEGYIYEYSEKHAG